MRLYRHRVLISKQTTFFLLFACWLFAGCSKSNSELSLSPKEPAYKILKMSFFQSPTDKIDSVFTRLDTTIIYNFSDQNGADIIYAPYEKLFDSLTVTTDDPALQNIQLADGAYLPNIILHSGVYYGKNDSLQLNSLQESFTLPVGRRIKDYNTIHAPTPETMYIMTGEYFLIKYSCHFKAVLINVTDSSYSSVTGQVRGTRVTTSYYQGQAETPTAFITIAQPIKNKTGISK